MKRLDPRSVIIGFLVAVIGGLSIGATSTVGHFKSLTVNDIMMPPEGYIRVLGMEGNMIMAISQNELNDGTLLLYNRTGQNTIRLSHTPNGDGVFDLFNVDGRKTISATHMDDGTGDGGISIFNKNQKGAVYLGTTKTGEGTIIVSDMNGVGQAGLIGRRK